MMVEEGLTMQRKQRHYTLFIMYEYASIAT